MYVRPRNPSVRRSADGPLVWREVGPSAAGCALRRASEEETGDAADDGMSGGGSAAGPGVREP